MSARCRVAFTVVMAVLGGALARAQTSNSSYLHQAAQAYRNAANSCTVPAGKACYNAWASYEDCVGNGGSCAQPSCTPGCAGGAGSTGAASSSAVPSGTGAMGTLSQAICNSGTDKTVCTLSQLQAANAAGQLNSSGAQAQAVGQLVGLGLGMLLNHSDSSSTPHEDPAAKAAELAAQQRAQRNQEAADLLQESDQLMASLNSAPKPEVAKDAAPNPAAALNSLLDPPPQAGDPAAAVNAILPDEKKQQPDPAATVADLLAPAPAESAQAATSVNPWNPAIDPLKGMVFPAPADPEINGALQDSTDQPDSGQVSRLGQLLQSARQTVNDGLNDVVTSAKSLISAVSDDPVVQWVASDQGNFTTMPLPKAGDSPETATDKVYGQAIVGFGDFAKEGSPYKAIKSYNEKMVDQMGADLGLATDAVSDPDAGGTN